MTFRLQVSSKLSSEKYESQATFHVTARFRKLSFWSTCYLCSQIRTHLRSHGAPAASSIWTTKSDFSQYDSWCLWLQNGADSATSSIGRAITMASPFTIVLMGTSSAYSIMVTPSSRPFTAMHSSLAAMSIRSILFPVSTAIAIASLCCVSVASLLPSPRLSTLI